MTFGQYFFNRRKAESYRGGRRAVMTFGHFEQTPLARAQSPCEAPGAATALAIGQVEWRFRAKNAPADRADSRRYHSPSANINCSRRPTPTSALWPAKPQMGNMTFGHLRLRLSPRPGRLAKPPAGPPAVAARPAEFDKRELRASAIRDQKPGTTVALKLNQGSPRPLGGIKRPAPFFVTFLGEQKSK